MKAKERDINRYAQQYLDDYGFEKYQVEYRRKKIIEILEKYKPESLLEIGCGISPIGLYYDTIGKYTIIEPSEMFCHTINEYFNRGRVEIINDYFSSSLIHDKDYDFILCSSLLHEIEKPDELLKEIYKVSNEKTIVHINVPNADSFHRILARKMGIINSNNEISNRNIILQQYRVFNMESLYELVRKNKFEIIEQGSYFLKPFTHEQMNLLMEKGIIDHKVLDGLYQMGKEVYGSEIFVNAKKVNQ